jgi:type IV pilus assembly protein PilM
MRTSKIVQILDPIRDIFSSFSKKADSVLVVDMSSDLKLFNVNLIPDIEVTALKILKLPKDKGEKFVIDSVLSFVAESNITHKNAILCPELKNVFIKRIQLPVVPENEIADAIKWQIKDELKYDLSKVILDYQVIKKALKEDGTEALDVICIAVSEEEIVWQVRMLRHLEFTCLSVNILQFGYTKLIERYLGGGAFGIIDFEEDYSSLSVYKNNVLNFYRELPVSISKLRESLASTLVSTMGPVKLSPEEVDDVLFKLGVPQKEVMYKDKIGYVQILSLLRPGLERLATEIRRSVSYFESQFHESGVDKFVFAGLGINVPGIDEFLSKELSLDISKLSFIDNIKYPTNVDTRLITRNYADIGLAVDCDRNINLLPYEFRVEKKEKAQKFILRWITFITVSVLVVSFVFLKTMTSSYKKRYENVKGHLAVLAQIKETKDKVNALNGFFNDVKQKESPAGVILKKLSIITPDKVFIEEFLINCETKDGVMTGNVRGIGAEPEVILAKYADDMAKSGYFKDISITSVEKGAQENREAAVFRIVFKLV